jgi:catechol 2,3-dioxygenase-like lactoylglutathione lyase family enzyme
VFGRHGSDAFPGTDILVARGRAILLGVNARVAGFDHIQIAAPEGCESEARHFYGALLGLREIEKPPILRARGGCWFECGSQQLHIGVERDFLAARKAHPAFAVFDLDDLREALSTQGVVVIDDDTIAGTRRFYAEDPWGNRLEFVEIST